MLKCKMYTRGARLIKKTLAMFRFRPKKRKGNMIAFVVFFLYCHSIYCRSKVIAISVFIFYFHGNMCKFFTSCVDIRKVKICHKQLFRFEQQKIDQRHMIENAIQICRFLFGRTLQIKLVCGSRVLEWQIIFSPNYFDVCVCFLIRG